MNREIEELKNLIKNKNIILFVGAGVSATLKLPSWNELMEVIAEELDYDSDIFSTYGDNLLLAEYYALKRGGIGGIRSLFDKKWSNYTEKIKESKIFEAIVKLSFPIIYTTNYDQCIEDAHKIYGVEFSKIISIDNFVDIDVKKRQIVKYHGDTTSDSSIVLTESSYFERLDFESPLDIKLRSDTLGKSILFIGYGLNDINVRYLIYKLNKLWNNSKVKNRAKSYIFLTNPNPVLEEVLQNRNIHTIIGKKNDKTESLQEFLLELLN